MAGSLHGSARTTPRVRAALQASQEAPGILASRHGLSRTSVAQWRAGTTTDGVPMGPTAPHSTVLTLAEEAMVVEVRRRMLCRLERRDRLPARQHPKADALKPAPVPGAPRHLSPARTPGQGIKARQVRPDGPQTAIGYVHIGHQRAAPAVGTASSTNPPSRIIPGPTARPNA